jgi:hypothetical protein
VFTSRPGRPGGQHSLLEDVRLAHAFVGRVGPLTAEVVVDLLVNLVVDAHLDVHRAVALADGFVVCAVGQLRFVKYTQGG